GISALGGRYTRQLELERELDGDQQYHPEPLRWPRYPHDDQDRAGCHFVYDEILVEALEAMAISVSGSCRCATRLMAVGALLFGIATATQAERYETVTREDGSIEVRRVEFPEAAPAAE